MSLAVVALLATAIFLSTVTSSRADAEPKRIMMLHSFGLRFKPWTDYAQFIRSEISRRAQRPIEFDDQSLLNARLTNDKTDGPFVDYLHALYAQKPPDLIIAIGAPAANFVQQYRERIFPGTPMLFTAVEARRVQYDQLTEDDTVVAAAHDFPASFETILRVLPQTKTIAVVNGVSPNETFWLGELKRETAPLAGRVELKFYNDLSFEDILRDAANLPPHSAIFWHLMNVDAAGVAHEANAALGRLSATASAPVFSYIDNFFGDATTVGGPMHSIEELSTVAATVAVRILNGEKAGDIKTSPTRYEAPRFDWRQMQRWGISESDLPRGSTVLFKPPTMWAIYRSQILTVSAVIVLQAAFIALLLQERRRRHSAEMDSRQRMVELAHVNRFSTAGEMAASLAHEINQPLGAILNNVETAKIILETEPPDLNELKEIVGDIDRDNRRAGEIIRHLRSYVMKAPFEKKDFDLNDLVSETVNFLSPQARARQVALRSKLTFSPLRINADRIQLQQVLSNLILNAIDAASDPTLAERAVMVATQDGEFAEVSVSDTGRGVPEEVAKSIFDPFFSTKKHGMGMGLSIVRTIVTTHGGQIDFENRNGATGTIFRLKLPLA
ncbi:sensor histidine kinase [Microvirga tunisiensis]|uniref:sensor histidine kinase n=1 Tax=Microvirga tunisiensis TaxID=2108360 RepID=UPI0030B8D618